MISDAWFTKGDILGMIVGGALAIVVLTVGLVSAWRARRGGDRPW